MMITMMLNIRGRPGSGPLLIPQTYFPTGKSVHTHHRKVLPLLLLLLIIIIIINKVAISIICNSL